MHEYAAAHGVYTVVCIGSNGQEKWHDIAPNLVAVVGKNFALDTYLSASSYAVTGPYLGLIGAVSYSGGPAITDTMALHPGWTESGGTNAPTYTGNRKTMAFGAAASGSKTALASFVMSGSGTAKGVFMLFGSGAVDTKDDTNGVLYSAGLFSAGDKSVVSSDTLNVTYATSL